jgi:hypothetical protein
MKSVFIVILSTVFLLCLNSCQKELSFETGNTPINPGTGGGGSGGGGGTNVTGDLRAKFNGTQWVADRVAVAARVNGIINISGISINSKLLTITLKDSGVHQYSLDINSTTNAAGLVDSSLADRSAFATNQGANGSESGGIVTITSIDEVNKRLSGTFSFKVFRALDGLQQTVTEGSFSNISYATSLPPANASDLFTVKIDGAVYTPPTILGIAVPLLNNIAISGSDAAGVKTVTLYFPINVVPGTYQMGSIGADYYAQYNANSTTFLLSSAGSVTITTHNTATKRVTGTFNFTAASILGTGTPVVLTEGSFAATYQ